MATKSVLSTVYIKARVVARVNGAAYNPTADTVQAAFKAPGVSPGPGDWLAASWETSGTSYFARVLVGPGAGAVVDLAVGTYDMWLKITDNPEIPVVEAGTLRVY